MSCCAILCYVMLCYVILCYDVLCCVMLYYVMLCCYDMLSQSNEEQLEIPNLLIDAK